jgi:hypothetical protein
LLLNYATAIHAKFGTESQRSKEEIQSHKRECFPRIEALDRLKYVEKEMWIEVVVNTYSGQQIAAVSGPLIVPQAAVYPTWQNGAGDMNVFGWYCDGKHSEATFEVAWSRFGNSTCTELMMVIIGTWLVQEAGGVNKVVTALTGVAVGVVDDAEGWSVAFCMLWSPTHD